MKLNKFCYFLCLLWTLSPLTGMALENTPVIEPSAMVGGMQEQNAPNQPSWAKRASEVLVNAISLVGIRYQFGGNSPESGFDCSGFVRYVYKQAANLTLPHGARAISQLGKTISKEELQPGDLVFFNTLKSTFSHVGIYLGDQRFIHSPSRGGQVRIENMQDSYWSKRFNGAQRMDSFQQSLP